MKRLFLLAPLLAACPFLPDDPNSGVVLGVIECTTAMNRIELRGTASGKEGERLSLSKSGDGADQLQIDVPDCDEWVYDNDDPALFVCRREGNAASTTLWSVTYALTTGGSIAAEPVIWTAEIRDANDVVDVVDEARVVTLNTAGTCEVQDVTPT